MSKRPGLGKIVYTPLSPEIASASILLRVGRTEEKRGPPLSYGTTNQQACPPGIHRCSYLRLRSAASHGSQAGADSLRDPLKRIPSRGELFFRGPSVPFRGSQPIAFPVWFPTIMSSCLHESFRYLKWDVYTIFSRVCAVVVSLLSLIFLGLRNTRL